MKDGYSFIAVLLDSSGSMLAVKEDTIAGFNNFLIHQKHVPGQCDFTMHRFNTQLSEGSVRPIAEAELLTESTYNPAGGTALLDAIGITIKTVGTRLALMAEKDRPSRVVFVIVTDGEERDSHLYRRSQVFDMIKHQQEKYGWDFVFLGANQDAIREAESMGIATGKAMNFAANAKGTRSAFTATSAYIGRARMATDEAAFSANSFTDDERQEQVDAAQKNNP